MATGHATSRTRRRPGVWNEGTYPCLLCERVAYTPTPQGWEWFTGFFDRTARFCPVCQVGRARDIERLYKRAAVEPEPPHKATSLDTALRELRAAAGNDQ
ncbi:hypothetical protein B0G84_5692 [Paraburkholderia sp. BL8N3]|nr:hypothetical protein B0G84_5692 [Paraburkholderia sp. BL8N3]